MSSKLKKNIYAMVIVSLILLLSSVLLSYQNIQKSNQMLEYLSSEQIELSHYSNKLNYDIKKNQADVLQVAMLEDDFSSDQELSTFSQLQKSIATLQEFGVQHPNLPKKFSETLAVISTRITSYQIVQNSLIEAIKSKDKIDIQDAIIGFNSISKQFSKETDFLINIVNLQLRENIEQLQKNNQKNSLTLIFSFFIAVLLIGFSTYKFNALHNRLHKQLKRAQNAEENLQKAQSKLLTYNDDLEAQISKKTEELYNKIYTHFLSGLPNRNKLLEDITTNKFTYIAILNIDKFQTFNDIYGEETGNVAIKMSADFLREVVEDTSMSLYHVGGDEFVIVGMESETLTKQIFTQEIEHILKKFRNEHFIYEDKSFQFMMSAGLSFSGNKKILAYADMALKDAKKRNLQLSIFNDDKKLEKNHLMNIECKKELLHAFKNDGILSHFQPIVPIQDTTMPMKYESLVRLRQQDGKIIPPFNFLNVAKANRVYYKITKAVINNTLDVIQRYAIPCSLNFSLSDIDNERTMKYFFEILDNFKHNELITVELLETEDFTNYKLVYDFCIKVRSFGVKVALDDFGSGYSNFSHILKLPIDYIKIDASLISAIDKDANSQLMVETIVHLAHKLNILTIAEFVSSKEIYVVVKDLGVDYAQGYYLGKPLDISEYITL